MSPAASAGDRTRELPMTSPALFYWYSRRSSLIDNTLVCCEITICLSAFNAEHSHSEGCIKIRKHHAKPRLVPQQITV